MDDPVASVCIRACRSGVVALAFGGVDSFLGDLATLAGRDDCAFSDASEFPSPLC